MKGEKEEAQPTTGEIRCLKAERGAWLLSSSHLSSYWLNLPGSRRKKESGKCSFQ